MDSFDNSAEYVDYHPLFKSCEALETLREDEDFRELEIQVKHGGVVMAQKIILAARIPSLRRQVKGRLLWDRYDIDLNCATAIISYAYTGKLNINNENVSQILSISKDLQLEHIVDFCCEFVQKRLTLDNVRLYWSLSNNKMLPTLKNSCLELMQDQFESFVATQLFVDLSFTDLQSIISSDDLQVDCEEKVFEAIKRWIQTDVQKDREDKLPDLLKCVRWSQTSKKFRGNVLDNQEIGLKDSCSTYLCKAEHNILNAGDLFDSNPRNGYNSRKEIKKIILTFGKPSSGENKWIAETYDPATELSKTLTHLTLREGAAVVPVYGGEAMLIGGWANGTISSSVEVFSCRWKQSRLVASLNVARKGHGACAVGNAVFVCGGGDEGNILDSCEVFFRNRWSLLPEMKEARDSVAVVSLPDQRVLAIGGGNGRDWLSSVEFCRLPVDLASSSPRLAGFWRSLASMREARLGHAAVFLQGNLFVAGGKNEDKYLSSVEMLPVTNETAQWVSLPASMKEERRFFSLLVHSRTIFAFGNWNSPKNSVERLRFGGNAKSGTASSSDSPANTFSSSQWESLSPITSMERVRHAVVIPRTFR